MTRPWTRPAVTAPAAAAALTAHGITWDSRQPGTQDQQAYRREPPQRPPAPHRCLARPVPDVEADGRPATVHAPARAIAITSTGTGTAMIAPI